MQQSPTSVGQVKAKWKTLTRAYRASRDRGTGTSGTKFPYIKEMDELLLDKPSTSCAHVVSVGVERQPTPAQMPPSTHHEDSNEVQLDQEPEQDQETPNILEEEEPVNDPKNHTNKRKRKPPKESFLDIKRNYYDQVIAEKIEKRKMLEKHLETKEANKAKRHGEIVQLLKNKQN